MKNVIVRYLADEEYGLWDSFVEESVQGSIFNKSYWLKAVCNEFKILVCEENNKIIGGIVLPSLYGKFYKNPQLTPRLGVLLPPADKKRKYSTIISREMEIMSSLMEKFPKFKQFNYDFSYNFTNFYPFIWENYDVSVRYTYVIEDLENIDKVYEDFQPDVRNDIKRAIKNNIRIESDFTIDDFYEINKKTFTRQGMEMPYSIETLRAIDQVLEEHNSRKMFFALNEDNVIIAATYIIYDKECAYYLMGGADPEHRKLGIQQLLNWEGIKFASTVSKSFDFEGSMVPNIESHFRKYGGTQKIIHNVYKCDPMTQIVYNIARKNKNIIRKLFRL